MRPKYHTNDPAPDHARSLASASRELGIYSNTLRDWLYRHNIAPYKKGNVLYVLPEWVQTYTETKLARHAKRETMQPNGAITLASAAEHLGCSRQALYDHRDKGHITVERIGGRYYVDYALLTAELEPYLRKKIPNDDLS